MTRKQAPPCNVAPNHLSAIFVLAVGAWANPALSATGTDARCDQSIDAPPVTAMADTELTIQLIDHGANTNDAHDEISPGETSVDLAPESSDRSTEPRIDVMLRRIADEAQMRQPQMTGREQPDDPSGPLTVEKAETVEDPAAAINTGRPDGESELPGLSADELLRYRRQMLRKDI